MFVLVHVHDPQVSGDFSHLFIEYIVIEIELSMAWLS